MELGLVNHVDGQVCVLFTKGGMAYTVDPFIDFALATVPRMQWCLMCLKGSMCRTIIVGRNWNMTNWLGHWVTKKIIQ